MEPMIEVTTTHLQQLSPHELRPASRELPDGARIERVEAITPEFSKFLYQSVGSDLNWSDRLNLARSQWEALMRDEGTETHVLYIDGAPGGYVELAGRVQDSSTEVEIMYFGLLPQCIGRGLGGALLAEAISRAWDIDARVSGFPAVARVWVHTCSLDGPTAIANYEARGLRIFHTESEMATPGDGAAGLWPEDTPTA